MSYVVDVLDGEAPESYEAALVLREALTEARDRLLDAEQRFEPPSARLAELYRRLTMVHPCICEDSRGPWSDGPLINNFGRHAATLGISYSRVGEVLAFLIRTANEMGMWVLDPQDVAAHLADGRVLRPRSVPPPSRARRWWRLWT